MNKYPTKQDILENPFELYPEAIEVIKWWHEKFPKPDFPELMVLAILIADQYGAEPPMFTRAPFWGTEEWTIYMGPNPSFVSMMHELAHFMFQSTELDAQCFAVACLRIINPTLKGLTWKGHLLVPRSNPRGAKSSSRPKRTAASPSRSRTTQAGRSRK